jgi:hypothetical protein
MPHSFLLVTADMNLQILLQDAAEEAFGADTSVATKAVDLESAKLSKALRAPLPGAVFVIDARLPPTNKSAADTDGKAALDLLRDLRKRDKRTPAIILTPRAMAMSEIEAYCGPETNAAALPHAWLNGPALAGFVSMLQNPPRPTWDVIEIEVQDKTATCHLGSRAGDMIEWCEAPLSVNFIKLLANQYQTDPFSPGWSRTLYMAGAWIFGNLILSVLGPGLFRHLENASGGLKGLAFRFRVDDPALHGAPFEATVRLSDQDIVGGDQQTLFTQYPFVLLHAPITRRVRTPRLRVVAGRPDDAERLPRLLFIRSQVGEHPGGQTKTDVVSVPVLDEETGRLRFRQMQFRRLENIDRERDNLQTLEQAGLLTVCVLDLSRARDPGGAKAVLQQHLQVNQYDVVHFAGHSLTTKDQVTFIVLPGEERGGAEAMSIVEFAEAAASAGTRLVYLSSCQGSSANTVVSLAQQDVPHVLGFRYNVADDRAADFAGLFYSDLFERKQTICGSFRDACRGVYKPPPETEASPIWASPILASQSDDWMVQRVM